MRDLQTLVLKRAVCDGLMSGHPWVFRDKVEKTTEGIKDGQWLRLLDPSGHEVGTGLYQAEGGVAIRVFTLGQEQVTTDWLQERLRTAISLRSGLRQETDAFRLVNGEGDGLPGIVLDIYGRVGVLQTYSPGLDILGRYVARVARECLGLTSVVAKAPSKRVGDKGQVCRRLYGEQPYVVRFHEGPLLLAADLWSGQKSGTFLDLRGLRRLLLSFDLKGKRVLNLFSYTGTAGLACALAGALEVVNVDAAGAALEFGRRYHHHEAMRWQQADVFTWIGTEIPHRYDLIIVDPPSMASNKGQVPRALAAYHHLYQQVLTMLKPDGKVVACCCTSRISRRQMEEKVSLALRPMSRRSSLAMEPDHPATMIEADYLKVLVFDRDPRARVAESKKGLSSKRFSIKEKALPLAEPSDNRKKRPRPSTKKTKASRPKR